MLSFFRRQAFFSQAFWFIGMMRLDFEDVYKLVVRIQGSSSAMWNKVFFNDLE